LAKAFKSLAQFLVSFQQVSSISWKKTCPKETKNTDF